MMRSLTAISAIALLTACGDGQPFFEIDDDGDVPDVVIDLDGTANPDADRSIIRIEPGSEEDPALANEDGGGLVREVSYDAESDTYTIDNLAFDGANVYERDDVFPTLGGYPIYAGAETTPDGFTNAPVNQIVPYRAITGRSDVDVVVGEDGEVEPRTTFAIVRTGGYGDFGFGGFVYERNGDVVLPTTGQAQFEGQYAGVRVFDPISYWEYTTGDAEVAFDFEDFNINNGVKGVISNRRAFLPDGQQVELIVGNQLLLPDLTFVIAQGVDTLLPTGELSGELNNTRVNSSGQLEIYEEGQYYAIIAGDTQSGDGGELVGVFVVKSEDPRVNDLFVQETGGFILPRSQP